MDKKIKELVEYVARKLCFEEHENHTCLDCPITCDYWDDHEATAKQILSHPDLALLLPVEKTTPFNELYHAIPLADALHELADKLRVETLTVSRWERGQCRPSFQAQRQLNRLARKG